MTWRIRIGCLKHYGVTVERAAEASQPAPSPLRRSTPKSAGYLASTRRTAATFALFVVPTATTWFFWFSFLFDVVVEEEEEDDDDDDDDAAIDGAAAAVVARGRAHHVASPAPARKAAPAARSGDLNAVVMALSTRRGGRLA